MSYFASDRDAAITEAIAIVKAGLASGAISPIGSSKYADEGVGRDAGAAIGAMIAELAARLEKL